MRGSVNNFLIVMATILLQTTIIPFLTIKNIQPDIVLMVVVAYAFLDGSLKGSVVGFFSGLLLDLAMGAGLGLSSLAKTIVGYVAGLLEKSILFESILLPLVGIFVATILNNIIYGFAASLFSNGPHVEVVLARMLPSALYNSIFAFILFPLIRRLIVRAEGL